MKLFCDDADRRLAPALLLLCAASCMAPSLERFEYSRPEMGTVFRLVLYAPDEAAADGGAEAAFARLAALDAILSDYDPESELSRLPAAAGAVAVSEELWTVLARADEVSRKSRGAFDVTVGPFVRLWRRSERQGAPPSAERLAEARAAVGYEKLTLDPEMRTVALAAEGMRLDLGGIGKGYALDEMRRVLAGRGLERVLVDGGGDLVLGRPPPDRAGWRVEVESPVAGGADLFLELANVAVATSGGTRRFVEIDGVRTSHIIDPRTGLGLTEPVGATVIALDGMTADALASALCVLGPDAGARLVADLSRRTAVSARIATEDRVVVTLGFPQSL